MGRGGGTALEEQGRGGRPPSLEGFQRNGRGFSKVVNGQAYYKFPFEGREQEEGGTLHEMETGDPPWR